MDYKDLRFDSYGRLVKAPSFYGVETTQENIKYYDPFEEEWEDPFLQEQTESELYSLIYDYLGEYEDEISVFEDDGCFIKHNPTERTLELFCNICDNEYSGFEFGVPINGKRYYISNEKYLANNLHDDIFDGLIRELIERYDLSNKKSCTYKANEYLDCLFPINLLKDANFWTIYQRIKKEYKQAHFKDGFIYFNNTKIFVNDNILLYNGYMNNDIDIFLRNYKEKRYEMINPIYNPLPEFINFIETYQKAL